MLVYIYACEGMYGGMHGMYEECVEHVENIEEANSIGKEMSYNVIESYDIYDDEEIEPELEWHIYKVRDEFSENEVRNELGDWDEDDFVERFCESEALY